MNLVDRYLQKDHLKTFMFIHGLRIYRDEEYRDYQWRIDTPLIGGPFIGSLSRVFNIDLPRFKQLMHQGTDCMVNGQLFGFKTEADAKTAIRNLDNYLGGTP